ncbi:MAG: VaFE repeat-containing surface-anchored protein, partial [Acutalibacteraceae bacterium]
MYNAKKVFTKALAFLIALVLMLVGLPLAASAAITNNAFSGDSYEFPYSLTGTATSGFGSHNIKLYDPLTGKYYRAFCGNANKATPYGVTYTRNRILDPNDPVDGQKNRVILRALYYGFGGKGYAGYNTTKWVIQWAETRANYSVDTNFFKLCGINTDTSPYRYYTDAEMKKIRVTINEKFNSNNVASDITPITVTPILNGDELKIIPSKDTLSSSYKQVITATENYWRQESETIKLTGNGTAEITVPSGYSFVYNGKTYSAGTHTVNAGYSGYVWCSADNKGTATITGKYTKDTFLGAVYGAGSSYQPLISRVIVPQTETAQFSFSASFDGGIELQLQKNSANPDMTDGNSCYSFEGAEFNVYSDFAKANAARTKDTAEAKDDGRIGMIVTDKSGKGTLTEGGNAKLMPIGTYYAVERTAPLGYKLSKELYTFTDTNTTDYGVPIYKAENIKTGKQEISDEPYNDPMFIEISKTDENGNLIKALEATFEVKYYDGYYTDESQLSGKTPTATWLFKTINGRVAYDKLHLVSGSDLYFRDALQTEPAIPLGTITIQEKDSPPGYARDDTLRIRQIQRKSETGTVEEDYTFKMEIPNVPVSISTSATVNSVFESSSSTVTDTVFYSGLEPNTNYTVTGWLVKKSSGALVSLSGSDGTVSNNKVTKSFTTTADGKGSVQIKYNFNSTGYGGETVVAFAEVRNSEGTVIGEHKDIDSKDQSIQFKPPGIATSAICYNSNSRYIYPYDDVGITDTISFQNLVSDTYTITPKAMLISKDGKSVEKEIPITLDSTNVKALSGNGSVDVEFTVRRNEFM